MKQHPEQHGAAIAQALGGKVYAQLKSKFKFALPGKNRKD